MDCRFTNCFRWLPPFRKFPCRLIGHGRASLISSATDTADTATFTNVLEGKWGEMGKRCGGGGDNFKKGGPHGSKAPSGRLRRQLRRQVVQSRRPDSLSLVPAQVAAGGLAWARTSRVWGLCHLRAHPPMPCGVPQLRACSLGWGDWGGWTHPPSLVRPLPAGFRQLCPLLSVLFC